MTAKKKNPMPKRDRDVRRAAAVKAAEAHQGWPKPTTTPAKAFGLGMRRFDEPRMIVRIKGERP